MLCLWKLCPLIFPEDTGMLNRQISRMQCTKKFIPSNLEWEWAEGSGMLNCHAPQLNKFLSSKKYFAHSFEGDLENTPSLMPLISLFQNQEKTYPTILLFHVTQGSLFHKPRTCGALAARDAVQPLLQVCGNVPSVVLLTLPKPGTFHLKRTEKVGEIRNRNCRKLLQERQQSSL